MTRYTITVGRFTVTDFFDNNAFHARSAHAIHGLGRDVQRRLGLSGRYARLHLGMGARIPYAGNWSLRYGSAAEPRVANGLRFDRRLFRDRGDMFEANAAGILADTPAPFACSSYLQSHRFGQLRRGHRARGADGQPRRRHRDAPSRHAEVWRRNQRRPADHQGRRRVRPAGMERRQDRKLRFHGHRPAGDRAASR